MPDTATACRVTYVETLAMSAADARAILADFTAVRASLPGLAGALLLERAAVAGQFALVEAGTLAAVTATTAVQARDAALAPLLVAPSDTRSHAALSVGPGAWNATVEAVWVVTHVDVVPAHKDSGVARVARLADDSRGRHGCLGFDAWQQTDRPNHMTLVETWAGEAARDDHRAAEETRGFRDHLAPVSGALYDERVYRRVAV